MCLCIIASHQFNSQWFCTGIEHIMCLSENCFVHKKLWNSNVLVILVFLVKEHDHCFSSCGTLIKQGSIGNGQIRSGR